MLIANGLLIMVLAQDGGLARLDEIEAFVKPYVARLKKELTAAQRAKIAALGKNELIDLHFGYGQAIRNEWLWNGREESLINFLAAHGIKTPDGMSAVLIFFVWKDLHAELPPEQRRKFERESDLRRRKEESRWRLETELSTFLKDQSTQVSDCFSRGDASYIDRKITLTVSADGRVKRSSASSGGAQADGCLKRLLSKQRFSPFEFWPELTATSDEWHAVRVERPDAGL